MFGRYGIAVCEENKDTITASLRKVNGNATEWTARYSHIRDAALEVEQRLCILGFSLKHFRGATASGCTAGPKSLSYGHPVWGSGFGFRVVADRVALISASCIKRYPGQKAKVEIYLPQVQIEALKHRAVADFKIQRSPAPDPLLSQVPVKEFRSSVEPEINQPSYPYN